MSVSILHKIDITKIKYSLFVKNLFTGEVICYDENKVIPSASLIKIPIMVVVFKQVNEKILKLEEKIKIKQKDKVPFSILSLLDTDLFTLKDLITLMIIQSDNTATNILIDMVGMDNVNTFIKSIGLQNTVLQRKMMDFEARKNGLENYTTAKDISILLEMMYRGILIDRKYSNLMLTILKAQLDNSMMRLFIPDTVEIAHKTGELEGIDHDVGIVFLNKNDYIFSMLTYNAESNNLARKTIGEVSKNIYDYFMNK